MKINDGLISPYFIEPDLSDPMRKMMDEYGRVGQAVAAASLPR